MWAAEEVAASMLSCGESADSGRRRGAEPKAEDGECESLTQRGHKCQVLQHHSVVQVSLCLIQELPLLLGEVYGHILKGPPALP